MTRTNKLGVFPIDCTAFVIVAIALIIGGLQITSQIRAQVAKQKSRENFNQAQVELDQAAPEILRLFTPPILEGLENNTLAEQGQLGNIGKLFHQLFSN